MMTELSSELQKSLSLLVDGQYGIINTLKQFPLQDDEVPLHIFNAKCASPCYLSSSEIDRYDDILAAGCAFSIEQALWSTLGEAVERYSASNWQEFDFTFTTIGQLPHAPIACEQLISFSEKQYASSNFRFAPYNSKLPRHWYTGTTWVSGQAQAVSIPAEYIWLHFPTQHQAELPQISTGFACGPDIDFALCTGLREVIERDGFSCAWLSDYSPPSINLSPSLCEQLPEQVLSLLRNTRYQIQLSWLTNDVDIPVVLALVRNSFNEGTTIGAACHLNAAIAVEKAVIEAFHTWNWQLDMKRNGRKRPAAAEVKQFSDHVAFYIDDNNHHHLQQFYRAEAIDLEDKYLAPTPLDKKQEAATLVSKLQQNNFQASYAEVTPSDIQSIKLCVVKAFVPGLQPLHCGYGNHHGDKRRLDTFAQWAGMSMYTLKETPHAFP